MPGSNKRPARSSNPLWDKIGTQAADQAIQPNPDAKLVPRRLLVPKATQPRIHVSEEEQQELLADIAANGITAPLLVRPLGDGRYEIIGGGRRYAAATALALAQVPVIIRDVDDDTAEVLALTDNIRHAPLSTVDEAIYVEELYKRLASLEETARIVGKSRTWVLKRHRLVTMPGAVAAYEAGMISLDDLTKAPPREPLAADLTLAEAEHLGVEAAGEDSPVRPTSSAPAPAELEYQSPFASAAPLPADGTPTARLASMEELAPPIQWTRPTDFGPAPAPPAEDPGPPAPPVSRETVLVTKQWQRMTAYADDLDVATLSAEQRAALRGTIPATVAALHRLLARLDESPQ